MSYAFGFLTIASYLIGSIPVTYLVARYSQGIDIRQYGSGHVGAGNLRRIISMKAAVPVALFDLLKGVMVLAIAQYIFRLDITELTVVGIAAIVGHNWPIFLRFNGGRGLATSSGVALFLMPLGIVVYLAVAPTYFLAKSTALPVIIVMAILPLAGWLLHQPVPIIIGMLAIFLILAIRRLTAPKSAISATVSTRELLLNRLLFDRDIKDAHTWMYRKPAEKPQPDKLAVNHNNQEKG